MPQQPATVRKINAANGEDDRPCPLPKSVIRHALEDERHKRGAADRQQDRRPSGPNRHVSDARQRAEIKRPHDVAERLRDGFVALVVLRSSALRPAICQRTYSCFCILLGSHGGNADLDEALHGAQQKIYPPWRTRALLQASQDGPRPTGFSATGRWWLSNSCEEESPRSVARPNLEARPCPAPSACGPHCSTPRRTKNLSQVRLV